jgi:hypothetical protein
MSLSHRWLPADRTFNAPFVSASATTVADRGDADAMPAFWAMSLTRVAFSYGRSRTLRPAAAASFINGSIRRSAQKSKCWCGCGFTVHNDKSISLFNQNYTRKIE